MGIKPNQIRIIWQGIYAWMKIRNMSASSLAYSTTIIGYDKARIEKGIIYQTEKITSDFIHYCVAAFNLKSARFRSYEETEDTYSDEHCIELLTSSLTNQSIQGKLLD